MRLSHGLQLAYCTNIHRGESWPETLAALEKHTLAVKRRVAPDRPFAIGLRLSDLASRELSEPATLAAFQRWLRLHQCTVFTINGFPFGRFHGTRVKEQVYTPDWTRPERLDYTRRLFEILARLLPEDAPAQGSVSTVPVSFKGFRLDERAERVARNQLHQLAVFLEQLSRSSGHDLHLGLEPEPCCHLETTYETTRFFDRLRSDHPGDLRIDSHLGVNYDCCHLAIEYENPAEAIGRLRRAGIRISKIHLSNALRLHPTPGARLALQSFVDPVYFHQVIERRPDGELVRYTDLDEALLTALDGPQLDNEWRVHFHIPLHAAPNGVFQTTADHVTGVLDEIRQHPGLCQHFEMETYTWEVLPAALKQHSVVDQLTAEYAWTLAELSRRGIQPV